MDFYFDAHIECAECDNEQKYQEMGEPYDFEYFEISEFEDDAVNYFKEKGWHRDDVLSDWFCADCKE